MKEADINTNNISAGQDSDSDGRFLRRIFRNESGNWPEAEKLLKEAMTYAKVVDDLAVDLVKADKKLRQLLLEAYTSTPKKDCLFYDSPVSPNKQMAHLKLYLKKLGWDGVRDVFMDETKIKPFAQEIKEAGRWLLKFKENAKA